MYFAGCGHTALELKLDVSAMLHPMRCAIGLPYCISTTSTRQNCLNWKQVVAESTQDLSLCLPPHSLVFGLARVSALCWNMSLISCARTCACSWCTDSKHMKRRRQHTDLWGHACIYINIHTLTASGWKTHLFSFYWVWSNSSLETYYCMCQLQSHKSNFHVCSIWDDW